MKKMKEKFFISWREAKARRKVDTSTSHHLVILVYVWRTLTLRSSFSKYNFPTIYC